MTLVFSCYTLAAMKEETISAYALLGRFARLVKLWQQVEKRPRRFGIDEDLHSSEIHMIESIGENNAVCVSDMARLLGVTKGAVSQTVKKLERKGLLTKYPDPGNSSRVMLELTAKGKIAFYAHVHWHETMDGGFKEYLTHLPQEKILFLDEFLNILEGFFNKRA